ncbi:uncharacterized protein LOC121997787 [Zingiber officinale]|uniref:uncharacterized protein LOC121997787 n=1 Tax=Zingiber officinale TaxID=94328 RepID=UPI001C4DD40E|nr:uncharacterized protein LOC121997787 [Zingiber officinale]
MRFLSVYIGKILRLISLIWQILGSTYIATLLVQPLLPAWIFNHENCCFLLVQTDADGLVNRGNTFKEIGRVTEAIQDYIRAVNIRPTMPEAHANLASAYKDSLQISSTPELKLMKCGSSGAHLNPFSGLLLEQAFDPASHASETPRASFSLGSVLFCNTSSLGRIEPVDSFSCRPSR